MLSAPRARQPQMIPPTPPAQSILCPPLWPHRAPPRPLTMEDFLIHHARSILGGPTREHALTHRTADNFCPPPPCTYDGELLDPPAREVLDGEEAAQPQLDVVEVLPREQRGDALVDGARRARHVHLRQKRPSFRHQSVIARFTGLLSKFAFKVTWIRPLAHTQAHLAIGPRASRRRPHQPATRN